MNSLLSTCQPVTSTLMDSHIDSNIDSEWIPIPSAGVNSSSVNSSVNSSSQYAWLQSIPHNNNNIDNKKKKWPSWVAIQHQSPTVLSFMDDSCLFTLCWWTVDSYLNTDTNSDTNTNSDKNNKTRDWRLLSLRMIPSHADSILLLTGG